MTPQERHRQHLHALMCRQALQRRVLGIPLQDGHVIQAHVGGDFRVVVGAVYSAGECLEATVDLHALSQHKERNESDRG